MRGECSVRAEHWSCSVSRVTGFGRAQDAGRSVKGGIDPHPASLNSIFALPLPYYTTEQTPFLFCTFYIQNGQLQFTFPYSSLLTALFMCLTRQLSCRSDRARGAICPPHWTHQIRTVCQLTC